MGDAYALRPVCCGLAEGNGSRTRFRTIPRRRHSGGTRSPGWARTRPPRGGRARPGLLWANRGVDRRGGARPSIGVTWLLDRPPAAKGNGSRTRFRAPRRNQHSGGTRPHGWVRTRPPEGGRARPDPLWADRGVGRMTRASRLRLPGKSGPAKGNGPQARFRAAPRRQHFGGARTPGGCERTRLGRAGASRSALGGPAGGSKNCGKAKPFHRRAASNGGSAERNRPRARFRAVDRQTARKTRPAP